MKESGVDKKELDKLLRSLGQFPKKIQKNVMTGAVRAASKEVVDEARRLVPKDTGQLARSIFYRKRRTKSKTLTQFSVSPNKKRMDKEYQKKGVKLEYMQSKSGRLYISWYNYGKVIEFGRLGKNAQPYMRPALTAVGNRPLEKAKQYLKKRLPKEKQKLGFK